MSARIGTWKLHVRRFPNKVEGIPRNKLESSTMSSQVRRKGQALSDTRRSPWRDSSNDIALSILLASFWLCSPLCYSAETSHARSCCLCKTIIP